MALVSTVAGCGVVLVLTNRPGTPAPGAAPPPATATATLRSAAPSTVPTAPGTRRAADETPAGHLPPASSTPRGSRSPSAPPPKNPAGRSPAPKTTGQATGQAAALDDLLRRNGPPPLGVPPQLDLFLGGGDECNGGQSGGPGIKMPETVEIPGFPVLCFHGFDLDQPVAVVLTPPRGPARTLTFDGDGTWDGLALPLVAGSPTGRYRVEAVQEHRRARTQFLLRAATRPRLWVDPRYAVAGDTVDVHLGGLAPGRPFALHLYSSTGLRYRASFTVTPGADGTAHLALRTERTTIPDVYAVNAPLIYDPAKPVDLPDAGTFSLVFYLEAPGDSQMTIRR